MKAGLSQERLSDFVGLTRTSITNIEKGRQRVSLDLLFALAEALRIEPHELLPTSSSRIPPELQKKLTRDYDEPSLRALKRVVRQTT
jgi:transcriptional regulator with XRE-family HTH domain